MKVSDFVKKVGAIPCDAQVGEKVAAVYGKSIPEAVTKALSYNSQGEFFDSDDICRLMSVDEVANASGDLGVDFVSAGLVPVLDVGDNCFVCFDLAMNGWLKYNIVDATGYCRKRSLSDMFA